MGSSNGRVHGFARGSPFGPSCRLDEALLNRATNTESRHNEKKDCSKAMPTNDGVDSLLHTVTCPRAVIELSPSIILYAQISSQVEPNDSRPSLNHRIMNGRKPKQQESRHTGRRGMKERKGAFQRRQTTEHQKTHLTHSAGN